MIMLLMDTEQADLLVASAEALEAVIGARQKRLDPEGFLKRTLDVSSSKLRNLRLQMQLDLGDDWKNVPQATKDAVEKIMGAFIGATDEQQRATFWRALVGIVISDARTQVQTPPADRTGTAVVRQSAVSTGEKEDEHPELPLQRMPNKKKRRATPRPRRKVPKVLD